MIKKIGLYAFLAATIVFTGCSQKGINGIDSQGEKEGMTGQSSMSSKLQSTDYDYYNETITLNDGSKGTVKQVFFGFDKFNLSDEMLNRTKDNAVVFSKVGSKIKLEGNCDEWGTDEYNYALGLKRAKSVKDALINEGINSDRIAIVSLGESNPVCTEKTKDCWKINRRVEHKVLP